MDFSKRYSNLNAAQKEAVDSIDGPVMVIAGPGTGKTELLSVRTANILQKTDTLPENILCLTFTDNGANAMRERLTDIIGKEAYKVAIHTFHSFGVEVINQNGEYFYQGAHLTPADDLSKYEVINNILNKLDYNNPLSGKLNDEYTHLSDVIKSISELKQSGLTSDELLIILDKNNAVIEKVEQLLSPIFDKGINKTTAENAQKQIESIRKSSEDMVLPNIVSLSTIISDTLEEATADAISLNSTKPITAWRNQWFKKDSGGNFVLKSRDRQKKLHALSFVYEKYLTDMQKSSLYDFDDMILRVVHAMEVFDDLRFNLQEKYQYIMVDEFQDTNMAQMRILHNLTNNEVHGDTPNIMVVGDDDQAIYSFQGADINNIINFKNNYPKTKQITLIDNYRSTPDILKLSRNIIIQGDNRLESILTGVDKQLISHNKSSKTSVEIFEAKTINDERHFIVNDIKSRIKQGKNLNDIVVLTRKHSEINSLLPYFLHHGIPVNYERRDNILELNIIKTIEQIAKLLICIYEGRHDEVNAIIPEVLSHKAWEINPIDIWKLSNKAYKDHSRWLDVMLDDIKFARIANWFISSALMINENTLEEMLDIIIGNNISSNENDEFVSPFYDYFFSKDKLTENTNLYIIYLEALRTIRSKLREYHPNQKPTLSTFIDYISLNRKIGNSISISTQSIQSDSAINIMTAHKSKGLEFDTVYVFNAVDNIWGERARAKNRLISYPENLNLQKTGNTADERLRLFYVAITRAKKDLIISYSAQNEISKETQKAVFLVDSDVETKQIPKLDDIKEIIESKEVAWYQNQLWPMSNDMRHVLLPLLNNYKLSVTHLNNFMDISRGGPSQFLTQNLLHFPQAKSPNASFGTAIHECLQVAHEHFSSTGNIQAVEDIISNFEKILKNQHLSQKDHNDYLQKGKDVLQIYLTKKTNIFLPNQKTELNFANQNCITDDAHITGKIDLANIDTKQKTIDVTDYKTGKPSLNWLGKTEHEKIKLYKYKQQLMFYKLLIENSRDYHNFKTSNGIIQFVEPTISGEIVDIASNYDNNELIKFKKLVNKVWSHIMNLDFPDVSKYSPTHKGILQFEDDLIENRI